MPSDVRPSSTCPKAGSGRLTIITITTNDDNDYDDQRVAQVADEDYDDNNENQCVITTIAIMMTKGGMLSFRWDGTSLRKNEEFNLREDLAWSFFHTVKVVHI